MSSKPVKPKFDPEIAIRSSGGAALIGLLFSDTTIGKSWGVSPSLAFIIGAMIGPLLDDVMFRIKSAIAVKRINGNRNTNDPGE